MNWQLWLGIALLGPTALGIAGTFTYMAYDTGGWRDVLLFWGLVLGTLTVVLGGLSLISAGLS